ncbi:hypothetical protein ABEB36_007311 [Hypothenemus hampei]|uniref:DUF4817 domain-containing protein n=1 Tax=Hypothenemus hampei TaxID=57062 RepID=A0ABD1ETM5_HYPHA
MMSVKKIHLFTSEEYVDMVFVYGYFNRNARQAAREYRQRYPNRHQPAQTVFNASFHFHFCRPPSNSFDLLEQQHCSGIRLSSERTVSSLLNHNGRINSCTSSIP